MPMCWVNSSCHAFSFSRSDRLMLSHLNCAYSIYTWTERIPKKGNFKTGMCGLIRYFVWFFLFSSWGFPNENWKFWNFSTLWIFNGMWSKRVHSLLTMTMFVSSRTVPAARKTYSDSQQCSSENFKPHQRKKYQLLALTLNWHRFRWSSIVIGTLRFLHLAVNSLKLTRCADA